ncbi:hypothetical protein N0B44_15660 [Roseibacterium beibuensis]|uniref:Uncharacterized protein n=1 Tax=[Roseibacterium] beibuensis TaxID=1193142 RepID=A0ABP9L8W3_9RHOB|nr:hypothetical protein [Roseibacterium beibuensis]MCS6624355.1 hypothetical protein [Roseibacterium beibuensis]
MIARLSPDRRHVEIAGRSWSNRFPVEGLQAWRAFHAGMIKRAARLDRGAARLDRGAARAVAAHRRTLEALDAVAAELDGKGAA